MKIVGFVPYWDGYIDNSSEQNKTITKVGGDYLINYSIKALNKVEDVDEVIIYTSSDTIEQYIDGECKVVQRPKWLDSQQVHIEEIIKQFLAEHDADIVVLLHPNSPFLTPATIKECVTSVKNGTHDSCFTGHAYKKFAWFNGQPLNYSLDMVTPQLSELSPVTFEQSSLYVFSREMFDKFERRIGKKPFVKYINHFEGHGIETSDDLEIAELIVNSGLFKRI